MPSADSVESRPDQFLVEVRTVGANSTTQKIWLPASSLAEQVVDSGISVFRAAALVFTERPLRVRIRAVVAAGSGPWSEETPPVPAAC